MAAVGSTIGYLMGAGFLSLYVQPSNAPPGLTTTSHNWVGAWWIGFLLYGGCALIVSIPLILSPKQLSSKYRSTTDDTDTENRPSVMKFTSFSDFKKKTGILLKNKVWIFASLAMTTKQAIISAFAAFILKYTQLVFHLSASSASFIGGAVGLPASILGMISGALIMKRFQLGILNTGKFIFILTVGSIACIFFLMFLSCENVQVAGLTTSHTSNAVQYSSDKYVKLQADSPEDLQYQSLISDCNADCQCSNWDYDPVCGTDGITYFSPCFAGCTMDTSKNSHNFTLCSCINGTIPDSRGNLANKGRCDIKECSNLVIFFIIVFLGIFLIGCTHKPVFIIILRCVEAENRSYGLGLQNLMARSFAFIPTPIYFGLLFDSQCLISNKTCDDTSNCLIYNTNSLPYVFFGTILGLELMSLCFIGSMCCFASQSSKSSIDFTLNIKNESETGSQITSVSVTSTNNK